MIIKFKAKEIPEELKFNHPYRVSFYGHYIDICIRAINIPEINSGRGRLTANIDIIDINDIQEKQGGLVEKNICTDDCRCTDGCTR